MDSKQRKHKILIKLKNKYRLLIINETNFKEKTSISLTYGNIILLISSGLLLFSLISWGIITLFPTVRDYAPGYNQGFDGKMKNEILRKMNDLEKKMLIAQKREKALKQIFSGKDVTVYDIPFKGDKSRNVELEINETKAEGERVANAEQKISKAKSNTQENATDATPVTTASAEISSDNLLDVDYLFFPPLRGKVATTENEQVKIQPQLDKTVKATMEGTVVFSGWTPNDGYVVSIQHAGNWISNYKNNAYVFKQQGSIVKAGESIAILPDKVNAPLQFELWHNGIAVNPLLYINF